jgi:hypothetical protein
MSLVHGLPQHVVGGRAGVAELLPDRTQRRGARRRELLGREHGEHDRVGEQLEPGFEVTCEERAGDRRVVAARRRGERGAEPVDVGRVGARAPRGRATLEHLGGEARGAGLVRPLVRRARRHRELDLDDRKSPIHEHGDGDAVVEPAHGRIG